jgi:hypothetical protein
MSRMLSKSMEEVVKRCCEKLNYDSECLIKMLKESDVKKVNYPLPFDGKKKEGNCNGIVKNHGLYTQCENKVKEDGYCKSCEKSEKRYGDIYSRMSVGLYEYKDKDGKSAKRYTEVLNKLKISKETILEYAKDLNIEIAEEHFEEPENIKRGRPKSEKIEKIESEKNNGKKGRPKKEKKVVEVQKEEEDLFATLIAKANAACNVESVEEAKEEVKEEAKEEAKEVIKPKKEKKVKEVDPAKEAEKQKKAEEKAAKEAEKQKKAEEKAAKEAEKQKKAEEKAAKEAAKQKKTEEKAAKEVASEAAKEEEADVVKKFEFEGKSYYKSKKSGMIYNMDQELVGKWNEERNSIDFEEEEEEEEYDE